MTRNFALATGYAALPLLPNAELSTDQWLGLGLGAALLGCAGLSVAVLALAREVGMLRLRLGPAAALEIEHEGPPVGERSGLIERFRPTDRAELALGVFVSRDCHVCHGLEPAVASLAREPFLAVESFDEEMEADLWRRLEVPGAPYAVALDLDGLVLSKGTFNSLAQLESVLATAEHRRATIRGEPEVPSLPEHLYRATESLAGETSRRGFLSRVSRVLFLATAGGAVAAAALRRKGLSSRRRLTPSRRASR